MRATVYCIATRKGGVGKTATSLSLASAFSFTGSKTLLVDMDSQCDATKSTIGRVEGTTIFEVLDKDVRTDIRKAVVPVRKNLFIIPGNSKLDLLPERLPRASREKQLLKALSPILDEYDAIIIDTPPVLAELTLNGLAAADKVIIPFESGDDYSISAVGDVVEIVRDIRDDSNPNTEVAGILVTKGDGNRSAVSRLIHEDLQAVGRLLKVNVFDSEIRQCTVIKQCAVMKANLFEYDFKSNASIDYAAFFEELTGKHYDELPHKEQAEE